MLAYKSLALLRPCLKPSSSLVRIGYIRCPFDPPHALSLEPLAHPLFLVLGLIDAKSIHLSLLEAAFVDPAVWPGVPPSAMFLVVEVVSLEASAVIPGKQALSVHHIEVPVAYVHPSIGPFIGAFTVNVIIGEVALVGGSICPLEGALAMLLAIQVLSLKDSSVGPLLLSLARLRVIGPGAHEHCAIIVVEIFSFAMSFIIKPLALVNIAVLMYKPAASVCLSLPPESLIE